MPTYQIRKHGKVLAEIHASDHNQAASTYVQSTFGEHASARRETGTPRLNGLFDVQHTVNGKVERMGWTVEVWESK